MQTNHPAPSLPAIFAKRRRDTAKLGQGWVIHLMLRSTGRISTLYRAGVGLKVVPRFGGLFFLLLLTTSASTCLNNSRNLGTTFQPTPVQEKQKGKESSLSLFLWKGGISWHLLGRRRQAPLCLRQKMVVGEGRSDINIARQKRSWHRQGEPSTG